MHGTSVGGMHMSLSIARVEVYLAFGVRGMFGNGFVGVLIWIVYRATYTAKTKGLV